MVEILGKDIDQRHISYGVIDWNDIRKQPVRPEVLHAIRIIAKELVLPRIIVEDGQLFAEGSGDERRYKEILEGFTKSEKLIARSGGHRVAFKLAERVLKGEIE